MTKQRTTALEAANHTALHIFLLFFCYVQKRHEPGKKRNKKESVRVYFLGFFSLLIIHVNMNKCYQTITIEKRRTVANINILLP